MGNGVDSQSTSINAKNAKNANNNNTLIIDKTRRTMKMGSENFANMIFRFFFSPSLIFLILSLMRTLVFIVWSISSLFAIYFFVLLFSFPSLAISLTSRLLLIIWQIWKKLNWLKNSITQTQINMVFSCSLKNINERKNHFLSLSLSLLFSFTSNRIFISANSIECVSHQNENEIEIENNVQQQLTKNENAKRNVA